MTKILVLSANPHPGSFGHSLATEYVAASTSAGHQARLVHIVDLKFDYNLRPGAPLEPDLVAQQESIAWADHVVVCMPIWWYGPPANLKAYFDRVLTPGFAYKYPHPWPPLRNFLPVRLLKGKSVRIITTQDSYRPIAWAMGFPVAWSMRIATFWFVGFWPVRHTRLTRVRAAGDSRRLQWITKIQRLGRAAK